jgi:hypothetical protein
MVASKPKFNFGTWEGQGTVNSFRANGSCVFNEKIGGIEV